MRRVYCKHSLQHHYENLIRVNGKDMKAFLNSKHKQCIIYKLLSEKWFRSEIYSARDERWSVETGGGGGGKHCTFWPLMPADFTLKLSILSSKLVISRKLQQEHSQWVNINTRLPTDPLRGKKNETNVESRWTGLTYSAPSGLTVAKSFIMLSAHVTLSWQIILKAFSFPLHFSFAFFFLLVFQLHMMRLRGRTPVVNSQWQPSHPEACWEW